MLPQMNGLLVGFGTGNIFRRLNREAPMGAIRRSIRDTMSARSHGMRASGLEDYFADLMREAGALDKDQGLESVHGAEPLHLYTSSYSGCYFFAWDSTCLLYTSFSGAFWGMGRVTMALTGSITPTMYLDRRGRR